MAVQRVRRGKVQGGGPQVMVRGKEAPILSSLWPCWGFPCILTAHGYIPLLELK